MNKLTCRVQVLSFKLFPYSFTKIRDLIKYFIHHFFNKFQMSSKLTYFKSIQLEKALKLQDLFFSRIWECLKEEKILWKEYRKRESYYRFNYLRIWSLLFLRHFQRNEILPKWKIFILLLPILFLLETRMWNNRTDYF